MANPYPTFRCGDCSLMRCFEPNTRCDECWHHFVNRRTDKTPDAPPRRVTTDDVKKFLSGGMSNQAPDVIANADDWHVKIYGGVNNPLPPGGVDIYPSQAPAPTDFTDWTIPEVYTSYERLN